MRTDLEALDIPGYSITGDHDAMDVDVIHGFLRGSYWARGIPRVVVEKSIVNSLCYGIFFHGEQVGFARAVTDSATFAYVGDVFVLEPHRGQGLSKILVERLLKHPQMQGLRRILLATADAHDLYAGYGFEPLAAPQNMMEIWNPDVYEQ